MNNLHFRQTKIGICIFAILMVYFTYKPLCQTGKNTHTDTIYMKEVRVPYNGLVNKKGRIKKIWYRVVKVDSGYIIKKGDYYVINGKEIKAELFKF